MRRDNGFIWALIFVLFSVSVSALTLITVSAEKTSEISARAAALYEPSSGRFLYSKSLNERLEMASTTKIMTALVVAERTRGDEIVKIPKEAVGTEGSSAYLSEGEELTVNELLYALLLRSANDASVALAIHTAGSTEAFALLMNERADSLGLESTNFTNPHGLHDEEHYTTAHDLAIIAAAAMQNGTIREIASTKRITVDSDLKNYVFLNHNKLLHIYDGCVGIKTGFTKAAGRCLVGAAERNGILLISVTLDAPNDWRDHTSLLDLGFDLCERRLLARGDDIEYDLPLLDSDKSTVHVHLSGDVYATLLKSDGATASDICLPRYVAAPVKAGERVGEVIFRVDGREVARADICAAESALRTEKKGFFSKIKELFKK